MQSYVTGDKTYCIHIASAKATVEEHAKPQTWLNFDVSATLSQEHPPTRPIGMFKVNPRLPLIFVFLSILSSGRNVFAAPIPPDIMIESHDHQQTTNTSGEPILRFGSWTINRGAGALELHGGATHPDGTQDVYQWIFDGSNGSHTETLVGTFAVVNGYLRFTDSADYFLKEVNADDTVGGNRRIDRKSSLLPGRYGPGPVSYTARHSQ